MEGPAGLAALPVAPEPVWLVVTREYVVPIAVFVWMVKFLALDVVWPFFASGMAAHLNNRDHVPVPPGAGDAAAADGVESDAAQAATSADVDS